MDNIDKVAQAEPSPPPYAEQADGRQLGYPRQAGYQAQPGYPQNESYPTQQPYTAQTGTAQPGYPLQTYPPVKGQQTSTIVVTVQVDSSYAAGDYEGARKNAKSALILSILAFIGGVIIHVVGFNR